MDNATITIIDTSGSMLQKESLVFVDSIATLNINHISNGIYMVNVQGASSSFNQKVFINK